MDKKRPPDRIVPFEEAYFHIGDGGLTLSIMQRWSGEEPHSFENGAGGVTEVKAKPRHTYFLRAQMASFGARLSVDVPLGTRVMVTWLRDALDRTLKTMDMKTTKWRPEFAFSDYGATHIDDTDIEEREVDILTREGAPVERPPRGEASCSFSSMVPDPDPLSTLLPQDIEFLNHKVAESPDPAQRDRLDMTIALVVAAMKISADENGKKENKA